MFLLVLSYSKTIHLAWTECSDAKCWLTKYEWWFECNWLEESSNYSTRVLETNVAKIRVIWQEGMLKVKCYTYHKSGVFYAMATIIFLAFYSIILTRLEVMSQCCNNLSYIFINTYTYLNCFIGMQISVDSVDEERWFLDTNSFVSNW